MYTLRLDGKFVAMFKPSTYWSDFYMSMVERFGKDNGTGVGVSYTFDMI